MIWEIVVATYLMMGLLFSWMSSKGHKALYGTPLSWYGWVASTVGWLPALIIAGWRKK